MKISIPRTIRLEEQLFLLTYSIYMVFSLLVNTFYYRYISGTYKYVLLFCIIMLLLQELGNRRMTKVALAGFVVLYAVVMLIMVRASGEMQRSFACVFAFAVGARNIEFKKIARITIFITVLMMLLTIGGALAGIITNYFEQSTDRNRYYLGYLYSLYGPAYFLNVTLLSIYVKNTRIKLWVLALLAVATYWLYMKTNSRLSFYLSLISLFIGLINKLGKGWVQRLKVIPVLLIPSYIVSFFVSLLSSIYYNPSVSWQYRLNNLFGGRLNLSRLSLLRYGVSLFGNSNIDWVGHGLDEFGHRNMAEYSYVDSLYLQFLQRYGIIFVVFFLLATTFMMIMCYRKRDYLLEIILAIIAFHGIVDNLVLYLHYNTFWLLIGSMLFGYFRNSKPAEKIQRRKRRSKTLNWAG